MLQTCVEVVGARRNNLCSLSLSLPRRKLLAVSGPSGSGKSSLVFGVLFAEARRRFERATQQFIATPDETADFDSIRGLSFAAGFEAAARPIGIQTLGSISGMYAPLSRIFLRHGTAMCPNCGVRITGRTARELLEPLAQLPPNSIIEVLSRVPLTEAARARFSELGFSRVRLGDEVFRLDELSAEPELIGDVLVDSFFYSPATQSRLLEALTLALEHGDGLAQVRALGEEVQTYEVSSELRCSSCDERFARLSLANYDFRRFGGCCRVCTGGGTVLDSLRLPASVAQSLTELLLAAYPSLDANRLSETIAERRYLPLRGVSDGRIDNQGADIAALFLKIPLKKRLVFQGVSESCPRCLGLRLEPLVLSRSMENVSFGQILQSTLTDVSQVLAEFSQLSDPDLVDVLRRVSILNRLGLGYLTLARDAGSISAGERSRVCLGSAVSAPVEGTLFLLDEPTRGLHPQDVEGVITVLGELVSAGASVVAVEHDPRFLQAADTVFELGPGSGVAGGRLVAEARFDELRTLPASSYYRLQDGPQSDRELSRFITLTDLKKHTVDIPSCTFPLQACTVIVGVSGAGKSTLAFECLAPLLRNLTEVPGSELFGMRVVTFAEVPRAASHRSTVATTAGLSEPIRSVFSQTADARMFGWGPGKFSKNAGGGCVHCSGRGRIALEDGNATDAQVCPECQGTGYLRELLQVTYRGKTIAELMSLTIAEARGLFTFHPELAPRFSTLCELGLDYLLLGQATRTLSLGERSRLLVAREFALSRGREIYILDEPSRGLHPREIQLLQSAMNARIAAGATMVLIEHQRDIIKGADWLLEIGPGAGELGGRLVYAGAPDRRTAQN